MMMVYLLRTLARQSHGIDDGKPVRRLGFMRISWLIIVYLQGFSCRYSIAYDAVPQAYVVGADMKSFSYLPQGVAPAYLVEGGFAFAGHGAGFGVWHGHNAAVFE